MCGAECQIGVQIFINKQLNIINLCVCVQFLLSGTVSLHLLSSAARIYKIILAMLHAGSIQGRASFLGDAPYNEHPFNMFFNPRQLGVSQQPELKKG